MAGILRVSDRRGLIAVEIAGVRIQVRIANPDDVSTNYRGMTPFQIIDGRGVYHNADNEDLILLINSIYDLQKRAGQ